ncbi:MAG TPA: kelch repeat-containing protein, partial [Planctomycetota bacterium]|nr:kelch repeat-containing protein [Planctomycetota bacterium]
TSGLWEWDGSHWIGLNSATSGPSLSGGDCSLAYDAVRLQLVLIQRSYRTYPGPMDTWTWDGAAWALQNPTTSPPPRDQFTVTYDAGRQRVELFGGRPASPWNTYLNDLWEWDGSTWTQRTTPDVPGGRQSALAVYDPLRQRTLLVGGYRMEGNGANNYFADIWSLASGARFTSTNFGTGCGGPAGAPVLSSSMAHPGADAFTLDLLSAPANAPALFAVGVTTGSVQLGAGCTLFVPAPTAMLFAPTNGSGFASVRTAISPSLRGFTFAAQAVVLDPQGPLAGLAFTGGLRFVVGD